jgi:hypothetical protein
VRLAHVIEKMRQGADFTDAILSMKKYQFDYSDLTPFEKNVMRRAVPFYSWMRKNTVLQLETLFTRPGKISNIASFQRWLQRDGEGDAPMDSLIAPEWMRRRLWGAGPSGDNQTIVGGLGWGVEDLALFDRPASEFLSALNPLLKAPLQAAVNRDFFRDTDLERAEIAPTTFRYFGQLPGGKMFLDAIDFRMVKGKDGEERYARANPRFLNLFRGITAPVQRFQNVADTLLRPDRGTDPNLALKFTTGLRSSSLTRREQMRQHMISMLDVYDDALATMQREGLTEEFKTFYIERDVGVSDPGRREAQEIIRARARTARALGQVRGEEREASRASSLRTGGR